MCSSKFILISYKIYLSFRLQIIKNKIIINQIKKEEKIIIKRTYHSVSCLSINLIDYRIFRIVHGCLLLGLVPISVHASVLVIVKWRLFHWEPLFVIALCTHTGHCCSIANVKIGCCSASVEF